MRLSLATGAAFILVAGIIVVLVYVNERRQALDDAESRAMIILNRNLATHSYFNKEMKPRLFEWTRPVLKPDQFEPTWMSSTFAVREIDLIFKSMGVGDYYYKECAVNARSPLNEADDFEKRFIRELNSDSRVENESGVRIIEGKPFLYVLRRGEVMEYDCMRCHSVPAKAPGGLVRKYGSERSFHRTVGEVISAISIRIPLDKAYANADMLALKLSGMMLVLLIILFIAQYWFSKRLLFSPLLMMRDKALRITENREFLGEQIPVPSGRELNELAIAFNMMSASLRQAIDGLELRVRERTAELERINLQLIDDITERKRQEKILKESEEKFKQVITSSKDAIMLFDAETEQFVDVNKAAEVQYGYRRDEFLTMRRQDISAEPPATAVPILKAAQNNTAEVLLRYHKKKDGSIFPVEAMITSLTHGDRKLYCAVVRDISERKILEEERLKTHMLESVGILAGGIAHDFNNLLATVVGYIGIAKMRMKPDDNAYEPLTNAELNCNRASELSSRLITFSTGGEPIKKAMSPSGLLTDVAHALLAGSPVAPEFYLPDDLYHVSIDERQIKQVVNNLILNAKEAMPKGGTLIISGKNHQVSDHDSTMLHVGKYLIISFRDNGIGIPSEDLTKIFDPYYSTKDTFSEKGLGLGLAVCYSIIKRHDGLITVESEIGKGTTFYIYLPAVS